MTPNLISNKNKISVFVIFLLFNGLTDLQDYFYTYGVIWMVLTYRWIR